MNNVNHFIKVCHCTARIVKKISAKICKIKNFVTSDFYIFNFLENVLIYSIYTCLYVTQ